MWMNASERSTRTRTRTIYAYRCLPNNRGKWVASTHSIMMFAIWDHRILANGIENIYARKRFIVCERDTVQRHRSHSQSDDVATYPSVWMHCSIVHPDYCIPRDSNNPSIDWNNETYRDKGVWHFVFASYCLLAILEGFLFVTRVDGLGIGRARLTSTRSQSKIPP